MDMADTGFYETEAGEYEAEKDPNASKNYVFDWTKWLAGSQTIAEAQIILENLSSDTPLSAGPPTVVDGLRVQVKLSGGAVGDRSRVICRITTSPGGETDDRSAYIVIKHH